MAKVDYTSPNGIQEIWTIALAQIEVKLDSPTHFRTWFTGTKLADIVKGRATIGVRNTYTAEWLRRKHQDMIEATLSYVIGEKVLVEYKIDDELANTSVPTVKPSKSQANQGAQSLLNLQDGEADDLHQRINSSRLNPKHSFEGLVVGSS